MLEVLAKRFKKNQEKLKVADVKICNMEEHSDLIKLQNKLSKYINLLLEGNKIPEIDVFSENDDFIKSYIASRGVIQYTCKKCGKNSEEKITCSCNKSIKEEFAEVCHNQWSDWMIYLFSKCSKLETKFYFLDTKNEKCEKSEEFTVIPVWAEGRWGRQMMLKYNELSEDEKNLDRLEADKFLALILNILKERLKDIEDRRKKDKIFYNESNILVNELKELIKIFGGEI